MTDPLYKQMTAFLLGQGIEEMEHMGKTYLGRQRTAGMASKAPCPSRDAWHR